MALTIANNLKLKPSIVVQHQTLHTNVEVITVKRRLSSRTTPYPQSCFPSCHFSHQRKHYPLLLSTSSVLTRACSDDGGDVYANRQPSSSSDVDELKRTSFSTGDGYVALFVRMLGLDNDPLDREQAIVALWNYSLGGKKYVDTIIQFHGAVNLTVNLLKSDSDSACEAAAGLLRTISSVNQYRDSVAASGAVEEIASLLRRSSLSSNVKEQSICTLWNLTADEKLRLKIANSDILSLLIKFLEDEDVKVKEAAGGVLANLALSHLNHKIMLEAGVIPKLAKLLTTEVEESKVIRKEAKNTLLELSKDEFNRILIMEEGLLLVPLVGAAAYKSFKPALHSWPSLPDGTEIKQSSKGPSRYGAAGLLLGLNIQDNDANLDQEKINAIVGRTQQQFLARIGAMEMEADKRSNRSFTLLPVMDGVARLVLILELEDESAITQAAESIADASINEHMRVSFKEAGAIKRLVQLINHPSEAVRFAAVRALEQLSVSNDVCQRIQAEGILYPLLNLLKQSNSSEHLTEVILNILTRILDPSKEMRSKFYDGPVNGSINRQNATRIVAEAANVDEKANPKLISSSQHLNMGDLLDSGVLGRLIEILKTASPNLQRKAASIIEFCADIEPCRERIVSIDIESGLNAVFQQKTLNELESGIEGQKPELHALEVEEVGHAISAASRLLTRLLDFDCFNQTINSSHFTKLLRDILKSNIPLHSKDWVAACLVKLSTFSGSNLDYENPINVEVTIYETIPRLIEQIKSSYSPEMQEAAAVELNRIISEGVVDSTRAVAAVGGIFPLVKLIENGTDRAVEAGLAILYNLSMDAENHAAIIAAGAVPALRRIVLSQRSQWMRALRLLRTLPT